MIGCRKGEPVCSYTDKRFKGVPKAASDITIPNPKDVITNALPTVEALRDTIDARQMDLAVDAWGGPTDDILQVVSMSIFMIAQAITSMASAKAIGEKEKKEKKIALILEVLGIVLLFVPFLDDITPEIDFLDGILNTISQVGNVALTIQSIILDPASAPIDILGLLTGGGVRDEEEFASMAAKRRSIDSNDLSKFGSDFEESDSKLQSIIAHSCFV